jgi:hypothetical protein
MGECAFYRVDRTEELAGYLEPSADLAQHYTRQRHVARRAAYALGCVAWNEFQSGHLRTLALLGRELATRMADGIAGSAWHAVCSALLSQIALARYHFWRFSAVRRLEGVRSYWQETSRCAHLWYCATHTCELTPWRISVGQALSATEFATQSIDGFHGCEEWQGRRFRWTSPVAILILQLDPGDYELCLDTAALRGADCNFPFGLFLNGNRIAPADLQIGDGRITAHIRSSLLRDDRVQEMMIVCSPPRRARGAPVDPRPLGMPIQSLQLTRLAHLESLSADARYGSFPGGLHTTQAARRLF